MKKVMFVVMAMVLLAFAGCAFADDAGHGGHTDITSTDVAETSNFKEVAVTVCEATNASGVSYAEMNKSDLNEVLSDTGVKFQVTNASNYPTFYGGVAITLADHQSSGDITLTANFSNTPKYAWINGDGESTNTYIRYPYVNGKIVGVDYDQHFSSAVVLLGDELTTSTGGSSSGGGCNAGFAGLLLLAVAPVCFFRKK